MANYSTNDFKAGLKVMLDGNPCSIMENEYVKPGKGQAFNRVKLRNLKTGKVLEKTFKSNESLEGADIVEVEMEYLYNDGELWNFMDPLSFEQIAADKTAMGDAAKWLKDDSNEKCTIMLFNGVPLSVNPPNFVVLKIVETDPVFVVILLVVAVNLRNLKQVLWYVFHYSYNKKKVYVSIPVQVII